MFQQLMHIGKPSDSALFDTLKTHPVPIISSASFPGWTEGGMPDLPWYLSASKTKTPSSMLVIDQESWPVSTKSERLDASRKFSVVYKTIKHLLPEIKIGFYSYSPLRDFFNAITPTNSQAFIDWQKRNDDMAEHVGLVDVLFPSIYFFYNRALNGQLATKDAALYFRRNLSEAIRLRDTFGNPSRPIIPYVWWEKHPGGGPLLDRDVWESMVQTSLDLTGNCLAWGGYQQVWDPSATWIEVLQQAQGLPI